MLERWLRAARRDVGVPERALLGAFAVAIAVGFLWGLPGSNTWAVDSISPRSCGMGAIVETYWPGHYHTYPPLQTGLLTALSLPWLGLAALRVGVSREALGAELIKPLYMTGIEVTARTVAALMALGIVWNTVRLWSRLAGRAAGLGAGTVVATNATLVYYAHTGNLEVPYLFWTCWALVEMDRVICGEPRELQALLFSAAAVLSKDQAAAALLLPLVVALAILPWAARRESPLRRRLVTSAFGVAVLYGVVSGALVNPAGFRRRVAFLLGPASQTWAQYPRGPHGAWLLAGDAIQAIPRFTSWPIALLAVVGVVVALVKFGVSAGLRPDLMATRGVERGRVLLPLLAAISFTWLFTLGARRSEDRFLLPQTLFGLPYAALVLGRAWDAWPRARRGLAVLAAACVVPALLGVASMDATLLVDARYEAERFLEKLPPGTHVEILGTTNFLPRLPPALHVVRPGTEAIADRQGIPGVIEVLDPAMDPRPRAPEYIVLATALSLELATVPPPPPDQRPYGSTAYHDDISHRLFRGLFDGSLGYARTLNARCVLPWPLECRSVHDATGRDVWIYARTVPPAAPSGR